MKHEKLFLKLTLIFLLYLNPITFVTFAGNAGSHEGSQEASGDQKAPQGKILKQNLLMSLLSLFFNAG
jgi:hypothetical protein